MSSDSETITGNEGTPSDPGKKDDIDLALCTKI